MSLQQWAGVPDWDPRATLAVLFTDIIDSTTLARTEGDGEMFDMLARHFEAARNERMMHDAYEIKIIGDAYMVAFRTVDSALRFALNFRADTGDARIAIRIGIHVGPVRIKDDDIYGLMVNYAARLAHVRVPGEEGIFLSNSAKENIEAEYGSNQKLLRFVSVSGANLKGFPPGERVWDVITPSIREARRDRIRAKAEQNQSATSSSTANSLTAPLTRKERRRLNPARWESVVYGRPNDTNKK
jgi:class 3 adenylate cyclase